MEVLTVQGSTLLEAQLTSPLTIVVLAAAWLVSLAYIVSKRGSARRRIGMLLTSLAVTVIIVGAYAFTIKPSVEYGIYLEDSIIKVVFYMDREVKYNLCQVEVGLVDKEEALDMIKIRTNGISDPTTGLAAGYFKTKDGLSAYMIITGKDVSKAITIRGPDGITIVGMPGAEEAYDKLKMAYESQCR